MLVKLKRKIDLVDEELESENEETESSADEARMKNQGFKMS